jgi:hypothetical protein
VIPLPLHDEKLFPAKLSTDKAEESRAEDDNRERHLEKENRDKRRHRDTPHHHILERLAADANDR